MSRATQNSIFLMNRPWLSALRAVWLLLRVIILQSALMWWHCWRASFRADMTAKSAAPLNSMGTCQARHMHPWTWPDLSAQVCFGQCLQTSYCGRSAVLIRSSFVHEPEAQGTGLSSIIFLLFTIVVVLDSNKVSWTTISMEGLVLSFNDSRVTELMVIPGTTAMLFSCQWDQRWL